MTKLNFQNRTLAIMDNLRFLRAVNNECIDLIAIDPPFAANETFTQRPKPPISTQERHEELTLAKAHGAQYNEGIGETRVKDVWNWDDDVHPSWKARIEDDYPKVFSVIQAVEACATENEAAYLCFMAARLIECHRVLKPTGSIYIHCDPHANSYLRMLLDAVFGAEHLRNEIVWKYKYGGRAKDAFGRKHDTILFYTKSEQTQFNEHSVRVPHEPESLELNFRKVDENGRRYREGTWKSGKKYRYYADEGRTCDDVWTDINSLHQADKERTGYATQKPVSLYERIIKASSNPGDVVLDIFAGCATTAVAAEKLGRQWLACDMAYRSWTMLKRRFYLSGYALTDTSGATLQALGVKQVELQEAESRTIGPKDLPARDDSDPTPHHLLTQTRRGKRPSTQTASWSGRISKDEAKKLLMDKFGPVCWGCGFRPYRPNGTLDDTLLEVDHIRARRYADGMQGNDELYNLALLHRTCNGVKRNKLTLEELRQHNAHGGLLYVERPSELVDLYEATQFAHERIAQHIAAFGYQTPSVEGG